MNLSELIDTHRGGRSYAELERDCGGSPSKGRLQQMVKQPIKNFPDPPTVRALAQGLKVAQSAVVLAAAESLGLDVRTARPRVVELMPADADQLNERQAAAVAHLVSTIVHPGDQRTEPDLGEVLAAQLRAGKLKVEQIAWAFDNRTEPDLREVDPGGSLAVRNVIRDALRSIPDTDVLAAAARDMKEVPRLRRARDEQDLASEAPDPEGPEHGA